MSRRDKIERALSVLAPRTPDYEAGVIVDRALDSPGLRHADPPTAAWLALVAYIRHAMTDYDSLLQDGYEHDSARFFVLDTMNEALVEWGARRKISDQDTEA